MSRQVRQRVTAVLLGGLLLGAPLLANGTANAAQTRAVADHRSPPVQVTATAARGVPTLDLSPAESALAALDRPDPDIATKPVAASAPMTENGLIGLLAAVSIVLVIGVSAGAIRAIVSERAIRIKTA